MAQGGGDWTATLERLLAGDATAFAGFSRLITGFLLELRAYDFEDEWEDLRQEVLLSVVQNARAGRLRDPRAFVGYVRIITRNKFVDRLKRRMRVRERDGLAWDAETARAAAVAVGADDARGAAELWSAVGELPGEQRRVLEGVYAEGKSYQEVSDETGIPLGTLKRRLRQGLNALRARLAGPASDA